MPHYDVTRHRLFFEDLAPKWDTMQPPERISTINRLIKPFDSYFRKCHSILEIGTGTGTLIPILRTRYPETRIFSIDLAHRMLVIAKTKSKFSALIQSDVHHLPFMREYFTGIICHNSFPHFVNKSAALTELSRVLQANGRLLILHDNSREKVNHIHQQSPSSVIHNDMLPPASDLDKLLHISGFTTELAEDQPDKYLIYAKNNGYLL